MSEKTKADAQGGEPRAYYVEHPMFGVELSLDQPSEDAVRRGWVGTPLYAAAQLQTTRKSPKFDVTFCSCGREFGPGDTSDTASSPAIRGGE